MSAHSAPRPLRKEAPPQRRRLKVRGAIMIAVLLCLVLVPVIYASTVWSETVALYSSASNCSAGTPTLSSTNLGSQVYGGSTVTSSNGKGNTLPASPWYFIYIDPGNVVVDQSAAVTVTTTGNFCDSAGYLIPTTETTGTWTVAVLDSASSTITSSAFTVASAVPDVPYGVMALFIPIVVMFLYLRRRISVVD